MSVPEILVWKDGKLEPGTAGELVAQLRLFAVLAARELNHRSDPMGTLSERLDHAADIITALTTGKRDD